MPARYRVKDYRAGGIYYIYSRADEDRNIFEDEVDYQYYLKLLERYAGEYKAEAAGRFKTERPYRVRYKQLMSLIGKVQIWVYSLMKRNVQLLVWQKDADGITKLMRRLATNYTMYLNQRHGKKGKVFSGVYKGVLVSPGEQVVYLSRYIHRAPASKVVKRFGPVKTVTGFTPEEYLYSSYGSFLKGVKNGWLDPGAVLAEFEKMSGERWKSYREFVDDEKIRDGDWLRRMVGE